MISNRNCWHTPHFHRVSEILGHQTLSLCSISDSFETWVSIALWNIESFVYDIFHYNDYSLSFKNRKKFELKIDCGLHLLMTNFSQRESKNDRFLCFFMTFFWKKERQNYQISPDHGFIVSSNLFFLGVQMKYKITVTQVESKRIYWRFGHFNVVAMISHCLIYQQARIAKCVAFLFKLHASISHDMGTI